MTEIIESDGLPLVAVFADESCLGNGREGDNPGAAAGVMEYQHPHSGRLTRLDYWISEPSTTNNRMALRSAIEAMRIVSRKGARFRMVFTSDSQYLVKGMSEWTHGWIARGWKRAQGNAPIENLALWQEAVGLAREHQIEWRWVRGHAGHPQNEYANDLAVQAAREQTASDGAVASRFDSWLEAKQAKGKLAQSLAPFPAAGQFRATRPYPIDRSRS